MDKLPQFGDEIKEKEFTMTDGDTFVNDGSYGTVPRKFKRHKDGIVYLFLTCLYFFNIFICSVIK